MSHGRGMDHRGGARVDAARWLVAALLLVAVALRCFRLADADIWWDEGLAVWATRQGFLEATRWTAGDVHPPLFFWSLWLWLRLVGDDAFALRMLVVFTGVLITTLAWPLGRRLAGRWGGMLAVAAVATSRFLVWWSMELRMYALAGVCVLVATLGAVRWLDGRRRGDLAVYAFGATAALYTVYLAGAALLAANAVVGWTLVVRPRIRRRRSRAIGDRIAWGDVVAWSSAQLAVLAAFAPWAIYASGRMSSWRVVEAGPSLAFVMRLWGTLLATGVSTDIDRMWPWLALFAAGIAAALVLAAYFARRTPAGRRDAFGTAGVWFAAFCLVPALCVWAITQPRSYFYSPNIEARYFVPFAAPALAIGAALIAHAARRHRAAWVLAMLYLAPSLTHLPAYYAPRRASDTLPTMALAIWSQAEPGDVVLLVSGNRYPLWLYHYERSWVRQLGQHRFTDWPPTSWPRQTERPPFILFPDRGSEPLAAHDDWQRRLDGIVDDHPRIWLVEYGRDLQDPADEVEGWLKDRLALVLSEGYGGDALHLFARKEQPPAVTGISTRWPGARRISTVDVDPPLESGDDRLWLVGPARRALAGDTVNTTLFPVTARPRVGPCRLRVTGSHPGLPAQPWTMDTAADSAAPGLRRVRASWTIPPDAPSGPWSVTVESCWRGGPLWVGKVDVIAAGRPGGP